MTDYPNLSTDECTEALRTVYTHNRPVLLARVREMVANDASGWLEVLTIVADRIVDDPNDQVAGAFRHRRLEAWGNDPKVCLVFLAVEAMEAALLSLRSFARQLGQTGSTRAVSAVTLAHLADLEVGMAREGLAVAIQRLTPVDLCDLLTCCTGAALAVGVTTGDLLSLVPVGA